MIARNSYLSVAKVCGDSTMELDLSRHFNWDKLLRQGKYDVVVATAQLILDGFVHAFIRMEDFNLIIFDEAHHASKDDCFSRIMRHHYRSAPPAVRPKIFGMTASPLKSDGDYQTACVELETTLDAKMFTASLGLRREIEMVSPPPDIHIIQYKRLEQEQTGALTRLIRDQCGHLEQVDKTMNRMSFHDTEHGSLVSDLAWIGSVEELRGRTARKLEQAGFGAEHDLLSTEWIVQKLEEGVLEGKGEAKRRKFVKDAIVNSAITQVINSFGSVPDTLIVNASNATPKVLKVIEVLRACGATPELQKTFCCIMFVSRQKTAVALTELLKRVPGLSGWLKPEWLVGHNIDHGEGMDLEAQEATLQRFGKPGSTNLLVATKVAEEGLDVSPCNCVIRFDLFDHHAAYLQSKGRARRKESLFLVLVEEANEQHYQALQNVTQTDAEILAWLTRLPKDQVAISSIDSGTDDMDEDMDAVGDSTETLFSPVTGACIRPVDSVSVLCHYVALLRTDEFGPRKPEFLMMEENGRFRVEARLPANAKIGSVMGPWCKSKRQAGRMASFLACRLLYEANELNENLLPRKIAVVNEHLPSQRKRKGEQGQKHAITRRVARVYQPGIPRAEGLVDALCLHAVLVHTNVIPSCSRPVLVLFPSPLAALPPVQLMMATSTVTVPATNGSVEVRLCKREAKAACLYSYRIMCLLGRQEWTGDQMPYLLLPTVDASTESPLDASIIDWDEVNRANGPFVTPFQEADAVDEAALRDVMVQDEREMFRVRLYQAVSLRHDLDPLASDAERGHHFPSLVRRLEKIGNLQDVEERALLEVCIVPRLGNLLDKHADQAQKAGSSTRFLWSPFVNVLACSASFFRSCTVMPSLMHRYDHVFLVREFNADMLGGFVDETLLIDALTVPSAQQAFNYEKLEFFGDCYLKLIATCWAFAKCDSHREGDLHMQRRDKISNAALLQIGLDFAIAEHAMSETFTVKSWSPPLLDPQSRAHTALLAEKTIADLVEAILGAGLASCADLELARANECAERLTILGKDVRTDLTTFQHMLDMQVKPKKIEGEWHRRVKTERLDRLQVDLDYTFTSPHLALEAVTHSSKMQSDLPSYERLEFLGDAVLDFLVVSFFKDKFPGLNESGWTTLKSNAVSNASLGVLCVQTGLFSILRHDSADMADAIAVFDADMCEAKRQAEAASQGDELEPFWLKLKPPKALADIIESLLGALFVDSGFRLDVSQRFFDRLYKPHFDAHFRPETAVIRTPLDAAQLIQSHKCTAWEVRVEEEAGGADVNVSLVFHGLIIAQHIMPAAKAVRVLECKDELDKHREQAAAGSCLDRGFLKAMFNACLPKNFIRDGPPSVEMENKMKNNRLASLQERCNCR